MPGKPASQGDMARIALVAAKRYKRRCWWAEEEDLIQEAWLAMMSARRTWDEKRGVPEGAYMWRAVVIRLKIFLWKNSAPVNAPHHEMEMVEGCTRVALDSVKLFAPSVADATAFEQWRAQVRESLRGLVDSIGVSRRELASLLNDDMPRHCQDSKDTYKARGKIKRYGGIDAQLYNLWRAK